MNKDAVLSFIKKNILSLTCGVVAILCVAATFYPLGDMVTQLQTEAQTQAADYQSLQSLNKPRNLPTTNPTQTDPGKLAGFPNPTAITWAKEESAKFIKSSQTILQSVQDMSAKGHEPVVPGAFARTHTDNDLFAFARAYTLVLSPDPISGLGDPKANPPLAVDPTLHASSQVNIQNDILHGCLPPTAEDIKLAMDDLWTKKYAPMVMLRDGVPVNQMQLQNQCLAEDATLGLRMKRAAASQHKMYVEKDAFTVNPNIPPHDPPTLENMWYAQVQLWMQRDLAYAIADENSKSNSILTSPVKRLISMSVPVATLYAFPPAAAGGQGGAGGIPVIAKDTDPIPPNYVVSPTGRYCNGMYDVLNFTMTVDVDASKVNEFIETLSRGRLITVNVQSEYALDSEAESRNGYLYGSSPTVRLVLDGEMLYMRSWTMDLMPEKVKMALGLIPGTPATPGGMPPGAGMPGGGMMPGPGGFPGMQR